MTVKVKVDENIQDFKSNKNYAIIPGTPASVRKGWKTMNVKYVQACVKVLSILDPGHVRVQSLQMEIGNSSAVMLTWQHAHDHEGA